MILQNSDYSTAYINGTYGYSSDSPFSNGTIQFLFIGLQLISKGIELK